MSGSGRFDSDNDPVFEKVGICHVCIHRRSLRKCNAFPEGIPGTILVGRVDHTKPVPGDNSIQFSREIV